MLFINGQPRAVCDGFTRRDILQVGGLGTLGVMLSDVLGGRAKARPASASSPVRRTSGKADACILIYLFGGPSQIDTFDMKPAAPADFRGEFRPIDTNVPGIEICEHFPLLAPGR